VRGVVQGPDARPIDAANVFLIETLEGVVTREDGRFVIPTAGTGPLTLVVRRLGFAEQRRMVAESDTMALVFRLQASGVSLAPVTCRRVSTPRAATAARRSRRSRS
jgi:hypothetical protein